MKRMLLLIAILVGGAIAVRRLLPAERREGLSRLPGTFMERCMEQMPEDSPPKVMMSSFRRMREQNEEIVVLLREQNELLRQRVSAEKASPRARPQARESGGPPSE